MAYTGRDASLFNALCPTITRTSNKAGHGDAARYRRVCCRDFVCAMLSESCFYVYDLSFVRCDVCLRFVRVCFLRGGRGFGRKKNVLDKLYFNFMYKLVTGDQPREQEGITSATSLQLATR